MEQFKNIRIKIEAVQWFRNGDHPEDNVFRPYEDTGKTPETPREGNFVRYYRNPYEDGDRHCIKCKNKLDFHGWIDSIKLSVCPGDWILKNIHTGLYAVMDDCQFKATFKKTQS